MPADTNAMPSKCWSNAHPPCFQTVGLGGSGTGEMALRKTVAHPSAFTVVRSGSWNGMGIVDNFHMQNVLINVEKDMKPRCTCALTRSRRKRLLPNAIKDADVYSIG